MCIISKEFGIVYMPVPKAACSSVKLAFASLNRDQKLTLDRFERDDILLHSAYRTTRFRPHRWQEFSPSEWWRIAVVRDPVKRLLSVYTNRVLDKNDLAHSPKLRQQDALSLTPDPDFFFQNLRAYMRKSSAIKHHALSARLYIGPKVSNFDKIYRTSDLQQLKEDLSARSGQTVHIPRSNQSKNKLELSQLKDATVAAIKRHVDEDYALLKSYFPYPFDGKPNPELQDFRVGAG